MTEWKDPVKKLAAMAQQQAETTEGLLAQMQVVVLAVAAMLRSHPDPQAFAQEFRRAWQRSDDPLACAQEGSVVAQHIESVLDILEESCSAPLNVRHPGAAQEPDH